jgi:hypothetical protein
MPTEPFKSVILGSMSKNRNLIKNHYGTPETAQAVIPF